MINPKTYEEYSKMSTPELCEAMADFGISESKANIARLIYEERQMAEQHKKEKERIELQHKLNMELMNRQVKWIKFSAILTAISTLTAAIAGALLVYMLRIEKPETMPQLDTQQNIQRQIEPSPNAHPSGAPRRRYTYREAERMIGYAEKIIEFCKGFLSTV